MSPSGPYNSTCPYGVSRLSVADRATYPCIELTCKAAPVTVTQVINEEDPRYVLHPLPLGGGGTFAGEFNPVVADAIPAPANRDAPVSAIIATIRGATKRLGRIVSTMSSLPTDVVDSMVESCVSLNHIGSRIDAIVTSLVPRDASLIDVQGVSRQK